MKEAYGYPSLSQRDITLVTEVGFKPTQTNDDIETNIVVGLPGPSLTPLEMALNSTECQILNNRGSINKANILANFETEMDTILKESGRHTIEPVISK